MTEQASIVELQAENARLKTLLDMHGVDWRLRVDPIIQPAVTAPLPPSVMSAEEKIALFRRLFRGRIDVYPIRWESKISDKSGYSPVCANDRFASKENLYSETARRARAKNGQSEWQPGICEKPRIKCSDCGNRLWMPLTDAVIHAHLTGGHTAGVYPLLVDDTCHFLALDFDDADWREDSLAFARACHELGVPMALEVSRSGSGAHTWIFFSNATSARDARRLGTAIISYTCAKTRQLKLTSYDRLFPSQDMMPKGGFGNLIALPLQKTPRESDYSVFVDDALQPHPDQWAFLASVRSMLPEDIEPTILRAVEGTHPLDVTFIDEEDHQEPWKRSNGASNKLTGLLPDVLNVTLANLIFFEKAQLSPPLANRLIRLAAFQNPEFYKAQAMRFPIWDKPRVIGCAENYPNHIALPRGCLEAAVMLLQENNIRCEVRDERQVGERIDVRFAGTLRRDQEMAAALIARRGVNTLVLVHRTELMKQWQERLQVFLNVDKRMVGTIGGGEAKPSGKIDIAVMQSLSRSGEVNSMVENYGHVIVDECHHIGAVSFDGILKRVKAKYVLGLTATPIRRDGQQPIIFMQCGPLRHVAKRTEGALSDLKVIPRRLHKQIDLLPSTGFQRCSIISRTIRNGQRRLLRKSGTPLIADERYWC